jgi:membrane protein required for colicin V production
MNWTDYVIILCMALSCVAGLYRGLLREVVSLLTWLAAVLLSWHLAYLLEPHLGGALAGTTVRPWAARAVIFVIVMVVGTALGAVITHFVRLALLGSVDRMLGFLFGFLRGLIVLGLLAMLCHAVQLNGERWYRDSTLVPYVEHAGNLLRSLVGEGKIRSPEATA